jgi:hypothetical protein
MRERFILNYLGELYENYHHGGYVSFELCIIKVFEITTKNLHEFFLLGT